MSAIENHKVRLAGLPAVRSIWKSLGCAAGIMLLAFPAIAEDNLGDEIAQAFKEGSFNLSFRYRYEYVDQDSSGPLDPITDAAKASTLRTRLVYKSAEFRDFYATIGVDDLRPIVSTDFNDTRNGKTQYPVVADPKATDLNFASITYTGLKNTDIVLGRQRIVRSNARFIGNVIWRQNEQTYDAVSAAYSPSDKLKLFYSYVSRVKRVFGPDSGTPSADFSSSSNLLDVSYSFGALVTLFGYGYWLDLENANIGTAADTSSNRTFGLRLTGGHEFSDAMKLGYALEYATQDDYADNPNNYDADYYLLEAGLDWSRFGVKAGYEVLEGNGVPGQSFQTPLATLFKFNGWADKFLGTPAGGLEDSYVSATADVLKGKWSLIYHDFSAENGSTDYGDELDFRATWSFGDHYSVLAQFALYNADNFATDTDKFWVMLTASF